MKKRNAAILYEFRVSFPYLLLFYAIQYGVVAALWLLARGVMGLSEGRLFGTLELCSMIFLAVAGAQGFTEDFKMLMQNGVPRGTIFLANLALFASFSAVMALIDTVVLRALGQNSVAEPLTWALYGREFPAAANWLWLFLLYCSVSMSFYAATLACHKIGRVWSFCAGGVLLALLLIGLPVTVGMLPAEGRERLALFFLRLFGIPAAGGSPLAPFALFLGLSLLWSACAFGLLRRTELR